MKSGDSPAVVALDGRYVGRTTFHPDRMESFFESGVCSGLGCHSQPFPETLAGEKSALTVACRAATLRKDALGEG